YVYMTKGPHGPMKGEMNHGTFSAWGSVLGDGGAHHRDDGGGAVMARVTRDGWGVSCRSGNGEHVLHVSKFRPEGGKAYGLMQKGDGDGRRFASSRAAFEWAYEHGYEAEHVTPWCRTCRVRHTVRGRRSGFCEVQSEFVR